ncbi:uncharacterized protein LOC105183426 isoform X7 [Harpegnathos saltator]|uniref:uncharacterized protein LOC105183426 isoform X7 n=1 Tax=Harpegnathos saltator TaxID=610380 RepID=UPI000DBEDE99|nr:uncharacterized protein LOC105183426 isoform X7 [Harpegnathos saltator]
MSSMNRGVSHSRFLKASLSLLPTSAGQSVTRAARAALLSLLVRGPPSAAALASERSDERPFEKIVESSRAASFPSVCKQLAAILRGVVSSLSAISVSNSRSFVYNGPLRSQCAPFHSCFAIWRIRTALSTATEDVGDGHQGHENDTDSYSLSHLDPPTDSVYMICGVLIAMVLVGVIIVLLAVTIRITLYTLCRRTGLDSRRVSARTSAGAGVGW